MVSRRRSSSLSDIKPASTNKYSIAGVRGPKYSWGQLALLSPSRSFCILLLSPSLPVSCLADRSVILLSSAMVVARTFRISYYRKYVPIGHRWTLCAILIRSIRYYETYLLSTMNRRQPLKRTDYDTRIPVLESSQFV